MPGLETVDIDLIGYADLLADQQPTNDEEALTLLVF